MHLWSRLYPNLREHALFMPGALKPGNVFKCCWIEATQSHASVVEKGLHPCAIVMSNSRVQGSSLLYQYAMLHRTNQSQPNNPLHGVTLRSMVDEYGRERLGDRINIRCFTSNPGINSSLKFLRRTDWTREKIEQLYTYSISCDARHGKQNTNSDETQAETGSV